MKSRKHISLFAQLSILIGSVLSASSHAIADEQALITSTQMKLSAYKISTRFHQLTLHEGDTLIQEKLESDLESFNSHANKLADLDAPDSKEAIKESVAISQDYADFAIKNEIATEGYTSQYAVTDLHEARHSLLIALNKVISQEADDSSSKYNIYKAAALIQQMTSDYVRRSVAMGGAGMYIENEENLDTPDIMAENFHSQLTAIISSHKQSSPEAAKLLRNIDRKWRFIKPSFVNYNQNTVPFLVTKYCDTIVSSLDKVAEQI
jgi:hypothetical protein